VLPENSKGLGMSNTKSPVEITVLCLPVRSSGQSVRMLHYDNVGLHRSLDAANFGTLTPLLHSSCTFSPQIVKLDKNFNTCALNATKDFVLLTDHMLALVRYGN
jgi:hypothetical protein